MCDYSLHTVASRPARVGDELVTTRFSNSITHGFSAVGEPNVAVCLVPGTEVAFEERARYEHPFTQLMPKFGFGALGERVALFRQINPGSENKHHDALEFANGKIVLLTRLCLGQRATVLQLPVQRPAADGPDEHKVAEMHVN
jgi:hypothetical protein